MNGYSAGNGTSISELLVSFEKAAFALEKRYGGCVQLARVIGSRWSYLAGTLLKDVPSGPPRRIRLSGDFGLVVYPGVSGFYLADEALIDLFGKILNG